MTPAAAAAAPPTWQEVLARLPQSAIDILRWQAGATDPAALAAWRRWVEASLGMVPAPVLISPSPRR